MPELNGAAEGYIRSLKHNIRHLYVNFVTHANKKPDMADLVRAAEEKVEFATIEKLCRVNLVQWN